MMDVRHLNMEDLDRNNFDARFIVLYVKEDKSKKKVLKKNSKPLCLVGVE